MNKTKLMLVYVVLIAIIAASFIPLPYYVTKPGSAQELDPLVQVKGGDDEDTGILMLTTIRMGPANIYSYAWAKMRDYEEILAIEKVRHSHESNDEYNIRQAYLMNTSKQNAISVAFDKAGEFYEWNYNGVYVLSIFPGMPAEKVLKAGDRIKAIDGKQLGSAKEMTSYIQSKKPGDGVAILYERNGKKKQASVELKEFKELKGKPGLGISLADDRTLQSNPSVTLHSDEIGGPSAGLMFTLEIYDQLIEEDLAANMKVAGTGTMEADGTVGRIGGIAQKVVAADRAGAEIFFAPDDIAPAGYESNYKEAEKAAEEIGTAMKVVPVKTFSDAIQYLNQAVSQ